MIIFVGYVFLSYTLVSLVVSWSFGSVSVVLFVAMFCISVIVSLVFFKNFLTS